MTTGHFSLSPILNFAKTNPVLPNSRLESEESNRTRADYLKLRQDTLVDVPELPGWHLWGKFNDIGGWETVYVGSTARGKTSQLRARLDEELRDECSALWAAVYSRGSALSQVFDIYRYRPNHDYYKYNLVSVLKAPARIIIWIGVEDEISKQEIDRQKNILMNTHEPTANISRPDRNALPDDRTIEIQREIDAEVSRIVVPTS
jgi:hypothetical protein